MSDEHHDCSCEECHGQGEGWPFAARCRYELQVAELQARLAQTLEQAASAQRFRTALEAITDMASDDPGYEPGLSERNLAADALLADEA